MPEPALSRASESGIRYWMERVVQEHARVADSFDADAVHDLRVAIRRCRSMAEGFQSIDGDPVWKRMRKAGKTVFAALGELRDTQVLLEWIDRLEPECPPAGRKLRAYCGQRETTLKEAAADALTRFDTRQWLDWAGTLESRVKRLGDARDIFQVLALEHYEAARALQTSALRTRSQAAFHQLRIGLKRFRYLVENFLPEHHERWGKDIKQLQDWLGEVHDLDVLADTARRIHAFASPEDRKRWQAILTRERNQRVTAYRRRMTGPESLWTQWRAGLPSGKALRRAVLHRFAVWAATLDPDPAHARRVARFSLILFDALQERGLMPGRPPGATSPRELLQVAALAHETGRSADGKAHHKSSRRLLRKIKAPPGWSENDLGMAALVARYHRGALPGAQRSYRALLPEDRLLVDHLAGILRLANSLDGAHDGHIRSLQVNADSRGLEILAKGYVPRAPQAERIAAARHLAETVFGLPVIVRPAPRRKMG